MPKCNVFHTYQAQIAGTEYIAIPRQANAEMRVEIHALQNPGVNDVTAAIIGEDGRLIEASRFVTGRAGQEYLETIDRNALSEQVCNAFQCIASAVLDRSPAPVPYAAIDILSLPRQHLILRAAQLADLSFSIGTR